LRNNSEIPVKRGKTLIKATIKFHVVGIKQTQ